MSKQHQTQESTEVLEDVEVKKPWRVILYNDNVHSFDEVIFQIIKAIGCSQDKAESIAIDAHTRGKAMVFEGEFEECFRVDSILKEIELITEIEG